MTRFTFQFIPKASQKTTELEINESSERISHIEYSQGDFKVITLKSGAWIETTPNDDIRYSVKRNHVGEKSLKNIFEQAIESIEEVIDTMGAAYDVCLLMNNAHPVDTYLSINDEIERFSEKNMNNDDPRYSELSDNTVKISFRSQCERVVL